MTNRTITIKMKSQFILIVKFLLIWSNIVVSVPTTFLQGNKISCSEEGQIVIIPFLRSDPCITCMCINSEIDCFRNACPDSLINCYHYETNSSSSSSGCCRKCLSCRMSDQKINSGETIPDKHDICKSYYCNSGTLTSYQTECHVPCAKPIRLMGQCCPSCSACPKNAQDGDEIQMNNEKCIRCYCFKGQMICHRKECPVLPCPKSDWIHQRQSCCPTCKSSKVRETDLINGSCIIGDKLYQNNEEFVLDKCTTCTCRNSTNVCERKLCPKLSCSEDEQTKTEDECCARCSPQIARVRKEMDTKSLTLVDSERKDCYYRNLRLKDGEWVDSCKQCQCAHGKIECSNRICPHDFQCPYGHRKVRVNGACCESCVPEDGRCTLKDSMTNITTFDGKNYQWNGRCNYVLSRDCDSKRFSVHLLHKFHNSSTELQPIYRGASLLIKIENTRIFLSHLGRVRVNRSLVQLPFIQMGKFSIVQTQEKIKLHAIIGVDILWQRNKSIEVKLKSQFRDLTCGLCGNFNLDSNDEFKAKTLKQFVSLERFVNSHKIGQNVVCPKMKTILKRKEDSMKICRKFGQESLDSASRVCNKVRQRFGPCKDEIESDRIYEECLANMCTCRGSKQCQCYTVERFIQKCKHGHSNDTTLQTSICKSYECPPGSEFIFCSYECRKTCQNRKQQKNRQCRRKECKSGCECIGNRVWFKGQCIPEVMCPF